MNDEIHIYESLFNEELFKKIQEGNEQAFKVLYLRYYQALCNFAFTYIQSINQSEEVVQEVFEHLWEIKDQINPPKNLKAYLFTAVKNKSLDKVKKNKTEQKYIEQYALERAKKTYQKNLRICESNFEEKVLEAINKLPERARLVYKLSRKEGLTYKEIAKLLDISIKTVESQMVRSLKKLRAYLDKTIIQKPQSRK